MSEWRYVAQSSAPQFSSAAKTSENMHHTFHGYVTEVYQTYHGYDDGGQQGYNNNNNVGFGTSSNHNHAYQGYQAYSNGITPATFQIGRCKLWNVPSKAVLDDKTNFMVFWLTFID